MIPIVIGVGDVVNRSSRVEDAVEPLQLMLESILKAIEDTELPTQAAAKLRSSIESIDVVKTWTWPYIDLPDQLSEAIGIKPMHTAYSEHGGHQPAKLFDEAARRVSQCKSKVAVITGGEALASLSACVKARKVPPLGWTKVDQSIESVFSPTSRELERGTINAMIGLSWGADNTGGLGASHNIGAPIHVYPLFENGYRAHRRQSIAENNDESAELYFEFAKVAEKNSYAWNYGKVAEEAKMIGSVSSRNRMICFPYPLLMNAFNTVNLAAACIVTSTEFARELGIPEVKWVYALGGAGTRDSYDFWHRPNYHSSPSISRSLDAGIHISGLKADAIDLFDFYSCFPIVPKLASRHLALSSNLNKPITLLGGLTSFGGAGNNYSMHALTAMVRELRKGTATSGLVLANGGVMTYQHVICLSKHPRRDGVEYPSSNPLPDVLTDIESPIVDVEAEGEAVIETYTVEFDRHGKPSRGHIIGRLCHNNHRFLANHADDVTLQQLASTNREPIGRLGVVKKDQNKPGRNLFTFRASTKL